MFGLSKFTKTSEGTLTGTIKLEHVQDGLGSLEARMDKGFTRIENLITQKDSEHARQYQKIWDRLEAIESQTKLHSFRLDQIEKNQERSRMENENR